MMRLTTLAMMALAGCSTGTDIGNGPLPGLSGVGQGGAQDFGLFRQILDDGGIPGPETIDDVGFFAEHVVSLPPPTCGEDVCLHGLYGAMGNLITGSPCTVLLLGMNSTLTPESIERPPLNLTVVVDTSGSMRRRPHRVGARRVAGHAPGARGGRSASPSVTFETAARCRCQRAWQPRRSRADLAAIDGLLAAAGSTNLYEGLRAGYESAEAMAAEGDPEPPDAALGRVASRVGIDEPRADARVCRQGYSRAGLRPDVDHRRGNRVRRGADARHRRAECWFVLLRGGLVGGRGGVPRRGEGVPGADRRTGSDRHCAHEWLEPGRSVRHPACSRSTRAARASSFPPFSWRVAPIRRRKGRATAGGVVARCSWS